MKRMMTVVLSLTLVGGVFGAQAQQGTAKSARKKAAASSVSAQLSEMKQAIDAQQEQIKQLTDMVQSRDQQIQKLEERLDQSQSATTQAQDKADSAAAEATEQGQAVSALKSDVADLKTNSTNTALALQETQKNVKDTLDNKLSDLAHGKVKIGATFYGNFSHYTDAGYAPAFQDLPTTQLAPGNSGLNVFEVTRAYINLFYTPSDQVTLRITPDIYRLSDGNLSYRLKYAFVDFQKIFGDGAFKKTKLTFGQTQQPLTDWEEGLSGHRYTYLTPWNYLSLSSTYVGAKLHGPLEWNGKEYLDYDIGVFTTASFHSTETNDKKQIMGRLSWYPMGTKKDRTGLGLTVFEDYGYNTKLPSQVSTPLNRFALLAHYQTEDKAYQIAFEYQLGRNATSAGNMFSGDGPPSGSDFSNLAGTVLSGTHTRQQGFDVYGHARLGHSPFSLWGFFQNFQPNTNFQPSSVGLTDNPLDFTRTVGGISYKVTDHFDFAFGDQNFHWRHPQGMVPGGDTNAIVIWTQFNY
jgi:flagellar motor protein MotB